MVLVTCVGCWHTMHSALKDDGSCENCNGYLCKRCFPIAAKEYGYHSGDEAQYCGDCAPSLQPAAQEMLTHLLQAAGRTEEDVKAEMIAGGWKTARALPKTKEAAEEEADEADEDSTKAEEEEEEEEISTEEESDDEYVPPTTEEPPMKLRRT